MPDFVLKKLAPAVRKLREIEGVLHFEQGLTIIPSVHFKDKKVPLKGTPVSEFLKRPQTEEEFYRFTGKQHEIFQIVCGEQSGLYALDIDTKHDSKAISRVKACIPAALWKKCYRQKTLSKGLHLWFKSKKTLPLIGKRWHYLELKGFGRSALITTGNGYQLESDSPDILHIPELTASEIDSLLKALRNLPGSMDANKNDNHTPGDEEFSRHLRREGDPPSKYRHIALIKDTGFIRNWLISKQDQDDLIRGIGKWFELDSSEIESVITTSEWNKTLPALSEEIRNAVFVPTPDNQPPYVTPLIVFDGKALLFRGGILVITGGAGSGKSSICEALISAAINSKCDTLGFLVQADKCYYFDTERQHFLHWKSWNRFRKRAGIPDNAVNPVNIRFESLLGISASSDKLAYVLEGLRQNPDILIVDGIGDLVTDVNDPKETNPIISMLISEAVKSNTGLVFTVHPNPNSSKARGHLGSELMRKADANLKVERDMSTDVRTITTAFDYGKIRSDFGNATQHFEWSERLEMHVSCEQRKKLVRPKVSIKREALLEELTKSKTVWSASDLYNEISKRENISSNAARSKVNRWRASQYVIYDNGFITLKQEEENVDAE